MTVLNSFEDFDKDIVKDAMEQINKAYWKPRDKKRIKRIMKLITSIWVLSPDLRLGQLLYNYGGFSDMDYNKEDDITEKTLSENFEKFFKPKQKENL